MADLNGMARRHFGLLEEINKIKREDTILKGEVIKQIINQEAWNLIQVNWKSMLHPSEMREIIEMAKKFK